jgi:hypothetical protein
MPRYRWSDGPGDFVGPVPRAGAAVRSPLTKRDERRRSPSAVELGIAARFLAPRPQKSILTPPGARNAAEVPRSYIQRRRADGLASLSPHDERRDLAGGRGSRDAA